MEYDKINNLIGSSRNKLPKFVTRKWIEVNDQTGRNIPYNDKKQIRFKTSMLRSNLCDFSDAYVLVKRTITVTALAGANNVRDKKNRPLVLKNNAPFISCISKINGELIENAEDLEIVMPMYNLLEYSKNYKKTTGSLYKYYRDELSKNANNDNNPDNNVIRSKSFKYKTNITGNTYSVVVGDDGYDANKKGIKETEVAIPLKSLGNFWRSLDIPLINCEVSLTLRWNKNGVITSLRRRIVDQNNPPNRDNSPTSATFEITECKLYVTVVTLSKDDDTELLTYLKSGFKRTITWNKYLSQMSNQIAYNNLNFLIDPTFTNVNRLFVLSFQNNQNNRHNRTSYSKYYLPKVQIKDFNIIIDKIPFFDQPVKNEEETYEKIIEIGRNSEYTTGSLLDYDYFKNIIG